MLKNATITFSTILFLAASTCFVGCSQKVGFNKSAVVPAAGIKVQITQDDNDNYVIDLKVENMAPPEALTPAKKSYVVWVEHNNSFYNIGQVKLNKNLKGKLTSTTPFKPVSIKITAEDTPTATYPSPKTVLGSEEIDLK